MLPNLATLAVSPGNVLVRCPECDSLFRKASPTGCVECGRKRKREEEEKEKDGCSFKKECACDDEMRTWRQYQGQYAPQPARPPRPMDDYDRYAPPPGMPDIRPPRDDDNQGLPDIRPPPDDEPSGLPDIRPPGYGYYDDPQPQPYERPQSPLYSESQPENVPVSGRRSQDGGKEEKEDSEEESEDESEGEGGDVRDWRDDDEYDDYRAVGRPPYNP